MRDVAPRRPPRAIHHADAFALDDGHRRQDPQLAQPLVRAGRQVEARRIGAVDDVQVVVAGNDQHAFGEAGMTRDGIKEFGPLGGAACIGHVAAHHDGVERIARMQRLQLREQPSQALVAASAPTCRFRGGSRSVRPRRGRPTGARCATCGRLRGVRRNARGRGAGPWSHRRSPRAARPPRDIRRPARRYWPAPRSPGGRRIPRPPRRATDPHVARPRTSTSSATAQIMPPETTAAAARSLERCVLVARIGSNRSAIWRSASRQIV